MIKTKDITVVVQGPVKEKWTRFCLNSIRKNLKDATIILSTWENQKLDGLSYDKLLINEDPEVAPLQEGHVNFFNLNRQLVSTINGIKNTNTAYCLKLRSDQIINNSSFLKYFKKFDKFDNKYKCFNERIISFSYMPSFVKNERFYDFFLNDYTFFGYTKDLFTFFDVPLMSMDDLYYWKNKNFSYVNEHPEMIIKDENEKMNYRYHAEQYCLVFLAKKYLNKDVKDMFDLTQENVELSKDLIVNNFVPLNRFRLGISLPMKKMRYALPDEYSSYKDYLKWYKEKCNKDQKIPLLNLDKINTDKVKIYFCYNKKNIIRKTINKVLKIISCTIPSRKLRKKIRGLVRIY